MDGIESTVFHCFLVFAGVWCLFKFVGWVGREIWAVFGGHR